MDSEREGHCCIDNGDEVLVLKIHSSPPPNTRRHMESVELQTVVSASFHTHAQKWDAKQVWEPGVVRIAGYERSVEREVAWWIGVLLTGGLLALLAYWRPDWELRVRCRPSSLLVCSFVLITRDDGHQYVEAVQYEQVKN